MNILAIVGSLRKGSFNYQLARAAKELVLERATFDILDYNSVPFFNQDIEYPAPASVQAVRDRIKSADGVWFFSPEYNHFFPGVLKNLIDWLSRPESIDEPQVLSGKPAALSGVSPGMSGTGLCQDHLVTLLSFLNMRVMNTPRLVIPNVLTQVEDNELKLAASREHLQKQVDAFLEFIAG